MTAYYANPTIQRILTLAAHIKLIEKYLDSGEHTAAGLSIELGIGANDEHPVPLQIGWGSEEVLKAIRDGLVKSLHYARQGLERELEEITRFHQRD